MPGGAVHSKAPSFDLRMSVGESWLSSNKRLSPRRSGPSLLRVKLDFAAEPLPRVQRVTRVDIVAIRRVELGALRIVDAEAGSFVEDTARDEAGLQGDALRVTWGAAYEELSPAESWNPKHVPGFTTLLSYRLAAPRAVRRGWAARSAATVRSNSPCAAAGATTVPPGKRCTRCLLGYCGTYHSGNFCS